MALVNQEGKYITPPMAGAIRYEYDFYAGSQVSIMIGDVVIDTATSLQFDVSQSKTPVFGYASQYYTFVADGKVMVQGALTVNFKEAGYLLWPIQRYANLLLNNQWTSPRYGRDKQGNLTRAFEGPPTFLSAAAAAEKKRTMQANVEQMTKWENPSSGTLRDGASVNRFWRELGALPDDKFEDWAETFEDAIWYGSDPASQTRDQLYSNNIHEKVMGFENTVIDQETILKHRRIDQYPPIDMWIVYGDMSRPSANHTVKKLMDVSFLGQSQTIEISGEPVYETYHFISKNVV